METLLRLGVADAGEVLTLQRAAYVPEAQAQAQAQAHGDLDRPPLRQVLPAPTPSRGLRRSLG